MFDDLNLNAFARYDEGLPLPDDMTIAEIAILWATKPGDPRKMIHSDEAALRRAKIMRKAFDDGRLDGVDEVAQEEAEIKADETRGPVGWMPQHDAIRLRGKRREFADIAVSKKAFLDWLESEGEAYPSGCQLAIWWLGQSPDYDGLSKKQKFLLKKDEISSVVEELRRELPPGSTTTDFKKHPKMKPYLEFSNNHKHNLLIDFLECDLKIPRGTAGNHSKSSKNPSL